MLAELEKLERRLLHRDTDEELNLDDLEDEDGEPPLFNMTPKYNPPRKVPFNDGPAASAQKELIAFQRQGKFPDPFNFDDFPDVHPGNIQSFADQIKKEVLTHIEHDPTVLEEAAALISDDRNKQYGKAADNLGETGKMWSVILGTENTITAHQVALCMVALKLVREKYRHKRDNIVDGIGYFALAQKLAEP